MLGVTTIFPVHASTDGPPSALTDYTAWQSPLNGVIAGADNTAERRSSEFSEVLSCVKTRSRWEFTQLGFVVDTFCYEALNTKNNTDLISLKLFLHIVPFISLKNYCAVQLL